ncbi:flavodoxin domain-containing protein [Rhodococcus sp. IEGM1300]
MKEAIVLYASLGGNTEEVATLIKEALSPRCVVHLHHVNDAPLDLPYEDSLLFLGSYTWGDGLLPAEMRKKLKLLYKEKCIAPSDVACFGTGDKMFPLYCRAVDEIEHHSVRHGLTVIGPSLKIEQSPRNRPEDVISWAQTVHDIASHHQPV